MISYSPFLIIGAFVAIAIIGGIVSSILARKRREALAALAARLGLQFSPAPNHEIASQYHFLDKLDHGSNRYAINTVWGAYGGQQVMAFDYHYETYSHNKGRRHTHHHHFSFFVLALPRSVRELRIVPEGVFSKIAQAFGYADIDFKESPSFSRAFCVRSPDEAFARAFCNDRMIQYLLANRDLSIEVDGNALAIECSSCLSPERIEQNLARLVEVRARMPDHLFSGA